MANRYWLMSSVSGLVMDVTGGISTRGTPLEVWTQNSPASANQLWTFEPGPDTGFFFIKSNLDDNLVVDVTGGTSTRGTPLEVWTQNSPASANQLWKFVPTFSGPFTWGYIQSLLDPNLVVDITGGVFKKGTRLEVWTRNSPSNNGNQLWFMAAASGNSYDPKITAIVPAGRGFSITGAGFQAGTAVYANYSFFTNGDPSQNEFGSFSTSTDFGGGFVSDSRITILDGSPGLLQVQIFFSIPVLPNQGRVVANWDGRQFTIIH